MASLLDGIEIHPEQRIEETWIDVNVGSAILIEEFAGGITTVVRSFIGPIAPIIYDIENETEEDDP